MSTPEVFDRLIEAIERRDVDAYAALYEQDAVMEEPLFPEPVRGRAAIAESEAALFAAFSDIEVRKVGVLADGQRAMAELVLTAMNTGPIDVGAGEPVPATGRRVEAPMVIVIETGPDGLITSERDYFDTASVLRQLGLLEI